MEKNQVGKGILRSGVTITLVGSLMVPSVAAFADPAQPDAHAGEESPSAIAQSAAASGEAGEGNVTIIVQLDEGEQGVSLLNHIMGNADEARHAYFKSQVRELAAEATGVDGALRAQSAADGVQELYDYYHAIDGFAVKAPAAALDAIKALDGVKNAFIEQRYEVPADEGVQDAPMNQTSLDMTGADAIDQKGEGQLVAIIDSGLDVNHEAFKGDLDDSKLAETEQSVGDLKTSLGEGKNGRYVSEKIPFVYDYADHDADVDPGSLGGMDHGTHVAGIVAANAGEVRGTAPDSQIMMLKVSQNSDGGIYDSVLLAAFDDAAVIEPDTVNVSLGSDAGFSDAASATYGDAFDSLAATGATVNVAAGNSTTSGYHNKSNANLPYATDPDSSVISNPSSIPEAFAVASVNNAERTPAFKAADGTVIPYVDASNSNAWGAPAFNVLDNGTYNYVDGGIGSTADADKLKQQFPDGMDRKTIILIQRGGEEDGALLDFTTKAANVSGLNPYAVVFYDNIDTPLTSFAVDSESVTCIMVTKANGEKLLAAADKQITTDSKLTTDPALAYQMSDFSSWGPNTDLTIKPEITAPGGNIYSTVPGNSYDYKSGTSMATPQIAGISALVHEYVASDAKFAKLSDGQKSAMVTQLLMSTANPVVDPITDTGQTAYYSPRVQGAGLANVPAATKTPVYLTVEGAGEDSRPKADLGESAEGAWSFTVVLHNLTGEAQSYAPDAVAMSEQIADGLFLTMDQTWTGEGIDVSFGGDYADGKVTAPANGEAKLQVNVKVQDAFKQFVEQNAKNGAYVEGFAMLKAASEGAPDLSVPYLGFYGDWDKAPAFDGVYGIDQTHRAAGLAIMNANTAKQLGLNPFDKYSDADPTKAVVSSSTATDAPSKLQPLTTLLRNARTLDYEYVNAEGKAVRTYSYDWISKTTYSDSVGNELYVEGYYLPSSNLPVFDGRDDDGNQLPDGAYTLRRTATLATDDAAKQSVDQAFIYDTKAPVVSNVKLEGEGDSRAVTFDVTDGSWLAGVNFTGPDDDPADLNDYYAQLAVGKNSYGDYTISDPVENADGTRTWHFNVPVSYLSGKWSGWSGPGGDIANSVPVYAWDYGMNVSERTDVVVNPVPATGLAMSASEVQLAPGQTGSLSAKVEPADSTQTKLTWKSSNEGVVKVDAEGNLEGVAEGEAVITAAVAENPEVTATAKVKVAQVSDETGVILSQDSAEIEPDATLKVSALVADGFAAGGVTWKSSDESVVKAVVPDSQLKQVASGVNLVGQGKVGEADVTATVRNAKGEEKTASIHVTVRPADYGDFVISDDGTLTAYKGKKTAISIPNDVTAIADGVFSGSSIQQVAIPASVKTIGKEAFKSTHNLSSVTFEKGSQLTDIAERAFFGTGVFTIELPEGVKTIGAEAFSTSQLERATMPESLTEIPASAFENCIYLDDLTLSDKVTSIGKNAFNASSALTKIKLVGAKDAAATGLPSALQTIGDGAFGTTRLSEVVLPAGVKTIGKEAFKNVSMTNLQLNEGLESIGANAFDGSRATSLTIPDSVTRVGASAFANMTLLAEATVGAQVPADALVGAFAGDSSLARFNVADDAANYTAVDGVLFNKDGSKLVAYPAAKQVPGGAYTMPAGVKEVASLAFNVASATTKVNIPEGVRSIGSQAFKASGLTTVSLPESMRTIGANAFESCSGLAYVNIGGTSSIGEKAFSQCPSLSTVNLRTDLNLLESVGAYAFSAEESSDGGDDGSESGPTATYNTAVQAIILPDSVTSVGTEAFGNLTGMKKAHIGAGLTSGAEGLFSNARSLSELTVSHGNTVYSAIGNVLYAQMKDGLHLVKSAAASPTDEVVVQNGTVAIDREAFRNNRVIKRVVLPEGLKSIAWGAFNTCDSLSEVVFPESLETVADTAFNWDLNLNFVEFGSNIKTLGNPDSYLAGSAFSGHMPTHLIVRGGQDATFVTSAVQDEAIPQTAYFGPGVSKLVFNGSGTIPKTVVVPAGLSSIEFPWSIGNYANQIVFYAPEGSTGWNTVKSAMDGTYGSLDASMQLKPYTQLGVTAAVEGGGADAAVTPGAKLAVKATATGGAGDVEFRFLQPAADGAQTVVQDWSASDSVQWSVPEDGSALVVEVRDATLLTERTAVGVGALPSVSLDKTGVVSVAEGAAMPELTATVDGAAEGAKVTYQWYKDSVAIEGATGASLTPAAEKAGTHSYHVVAKVAGDSGTVVVASSPTQVAVASTAAAADTSSLAKAVYAAEQLNRGDYTAETWAVFAKALAAAQQQVVSPDGQEAVDSAANVLAAAQGALVKASATGDLAKATVAVPDFVYAGTAVKPLVEVSFEGNKLAEGVDYTVVDVAYDWATGVGTAKVVGAGQFSGEVSIEFGVVMPDELRFADVPADQWFFESVAWSKANGVIEGYAGTSDFGPNDSLTRAQAATILFRYFGEGEDGSSDGRYDAANETGMADVESNQWYTEAANWAVAKGVVNGYETDGGRLFGPNDSITREQLCTIVANAAHIFNGATVEGADRTQMDALIGSDAVSDWAADSVAWSVNNGVISGVDTEAGRDLAPADPVTRAQMAAIMMNAVSGEVIERA